MTRDARAPAYASAESPACIQASWIIVPHADLQPHRHGSLLIPRIPIQRSGCCECMNHYLHCYDKVSDEV